MKNMLRAATFAVPFVFAAGLASAGEPMQLTDTQLDGVTAGADAFAFADAFAQGPSNAYAETLTLTAAFQNGEGFAVQLSEIVPTGVESFAGSLAVAN